MTLVVKVFKMRTYAYQFQVAHGLLQLSQEEAIRTVSKRALPVGKVYLHVRDKYSERETI